jgi:hypothetical protein
MQTICRGLLELVPLIAASANSSKRQSAQGGQQQAAAIAIFECGRDE